LAFRNAPDPNRSFMDEVRLYEQALTEAREHLARWVQLGKRLDKTLAFAWQIVHKHREAEVKQLEELIERVKQRY
jgi:hypothetical protein